MWRCFRKCLLRFLLSWRFFHLRRRCFRKCLLRFLLSWLFSDDDWLRCHSHRGLAHLVHQFLQRQTHEHIRGRLRTHEKNMRALRRDLGQGDLDSPLCHRCCKFLRVELEQLTQLRISRSHILLRDARQDIAQFQIHQRGQLQGGGWCRHRADYGTEPARCVDHGRLQTRWRVFWMQKWILNRRHGRLGNHGHGLARFAMFKELVEETHNRRPLNTALCSGRKKIQRNRGLLG